MTIGRATSRLLLSAAVLGFVPGSGCVTEGRPTAKAEVQPLPPAPADVHPTVVDVNASRYALDSDKNGYADLINVTVFLFNPPRYAGSLSARGGFEFKLEQPDGKPLATWDIPADEAADARQQLLPGPGYMFKLTLLDKGGDDVPVPEGQLWCTFTPRDSRGEPAGPSVRSRSPIRIAIGRGR